MSYVVKPTQGELAAARARVEAVLEACGQRLVMEKRVSVGLGWSEDVVVEALGGAEGVCWTPTRVEIAFSSGVDGWEDAVAGVATRQYGRAWARRQFPDEARQFWWQDLIEGAVGERLAGEVAPAYSPPWAEVDRSALAAVWPDVQSRIGVSVDDPFIDDRELADAVFDTEELVSFLPEAYAVVLSEGLEAAYDLDEFVTVNRSTVVEAVDETLDDAE